MCNTELNNIDHYMSFWMLVLVLWVRRPSSKLCGWRKRHEGHCPQWSSFYPMCGLSWFGSWRGDNRAKLCRSHQGALVKSANTGWNAEIADALWSWGFWDVWYVLLLLIFLLRLCSSCVPELSICRLHQRYNLSVMKNDMEHRECFWPIYLTET
jgi:hypothetical protein